MAEGWQTAALAEKIPDQVLKHAPSLVRQVLAKEAGGLQVSWEFSFHRNWLVVRAKGEDAEAFSNLLVGKFGEVPLDRAKLERWDVFKGFITGAGKVGFGVYIDFGLLEPTAKDALYPLHRMRAQLTDGVAKSCREILQENALVDYFPVKVVVTDLDGEKVSVELTDETRDPLLSWKRFPFDRVIAVGLTRQQAEEAVRAVRLHYDIIRVESLSLFVQCLLCKIGTDAPGIIARIGRELRGVALASYRTPRKLQESHA